MINWKNVAVGRLKEYQAKKLSLENIPMEILQHELALENIRSADPDSVTVRSSSTWNDPRINCMVMIESLRLSLRQTKLLVESIDRALGILNQEERILLERFFIYAEPKAADRLAGDLHMDVKTVYRRKDEALRKFTIALYGMAES